MLLLKLASCFFLNSTRKSNLRTRKVYFTYRFINQTKYIVKEKRKFIELKEIFPKKW